MINKQFSGILQQSTSSNSLVIDKSNRKFLVFCAFLFTLLLGSSLQLVSSYLPTYDQRAYQRAFNGRRFFSAAVVTQARTEHFMHELHQRQSVHANVYKDDGLYCDRSQFRTDVCVATSASRDVRVLGSTADGASSYQVLVLAEQGQGMNIEKVKPYTRKWETSIMETIDEVMIIKKVLRNGNSSTQGSSPWISSLPQNKEAMAQFNQSAKLHGTLLRQNIMPQQKRHHLLKQRAHQRGFHKLLPIYDPSGNSQQPQYLQDVHRSAIAGGQLRAVRPNTRAALLQHRNSALDSSNYSFPKCEVQHKVPAILFSTGGYTGNVYHEFNDGLIPLFITAQQYSPGQVVLIILEYHGWWMSKYAEVVAQISNYTVIDLARDKRVHCFPEVTVGLRIHDELAIHADNPDHASIQGFQSMLSAAYAPELHRKLKTAAARPAARTKKRPRLVLISRSSPRALLNEQEVIALAKEIGFSVQVLTPTPSTRMVDIYKMVNRCDVMVGVHGAAMTHLLFMKPGATFIQVVPLGTDWAAATYYGEPAQKLGLNYVAYKVRPTESSLWHKYARDDPVLVSPESVNQKGWWETKRIYLEAQDVTVSLPRMRMTLRSVYARAAVAS